MVRAMIYQQEPRIETLKRNVITSSSLPAVGSELAQEGACAYFFQLQTLKPRGSVLYV